MTKNHYDKLVDFEAMKKWKAIPQDFQELVLGNVFCSSCGVTTIVEYTIQSEIFGIILKGKCETCGKQVARVIED